jgi:tripartite-type tricarboxylate transporter receptor subunit TctC
VISLTNKTPVLVLARNSIPANDLRGLISWLKANPGKALAGTAGPGSVAHVLTILFAEYNWRPASIDSVSR